MLSVDIVVIGAGQAGLAAGYELQRANRDFLLLDKGSFIGESWRSRYDSLRLFTPRRYSALPGLPMKGKRWGYPHKDEIADYLAEYQSKYALPVQLLTDVTSLTARDGRFWIATSKGELEARQVIVSTGPFQRPYCPEFGSALGSAVTQLHTADYKNPEQLPGERVLVVGAGNSGAQIALELSAKKKVYLSASHAINYMPYRFLGRSLFWWYERIGLLRKGPDSRIGKKLAAKKDPLYGYELKEAIDRGEVDLLPRTIGAKERRLLLEGGADIEVDAVVWATGFKPDYSWIDIPDAFGTGGTPVHDRGVSPVRGLYFVGLPWQSCRGSALIGWVHRDAKYISQIVRQHEPKISLQRQSSVARPL
ncbi:NAD(P)/FAD-dependent oxidoreductase [Paenibacillus sp. N4]|nr:NAD(P)/FAD-dependent oxidoreductase [Paenibacillus vietnamensis]